MINRTTDDPDVFWMFEIGDQRRLSGLVLEIPTKVGTTEPAAQLLFLSTKEVLGDIICPFHHRQDRTIGVPTSRMAEELVPIAQQF